MEGSRAAAGMELQRQVARLRALVDEARSGSESGSVLATEEASKRRMDTVVTLSAVTPHLQTFTTSFGREVCFLTFFFMLVFAEEWWVQADGQRCSMCLALVCGTPCCTSLVDGECVRNVHSESVISYLLDFLRYVLLRANLCVYAICGD